MRTPKSVGIQGKKPKSLGFAPSWCKSGAGYEKKGQLLLRRDGARSGKAREVSICSAVSQ